MDCHIEKVTSILIENYPGHVYWQDINGVSLGCNKKQAETLNLPVSKVVGVPITDLYSEKEAERLMSIIDDIVRTGQKVQLQEELTIKGEKHYFLSEKHPIKNDKREVIGIVGLSIDITKEKKLLTQLNTVSHKLVLANQIKERFLENMAHDWRTPLGNIQAISELLSLEEIDSEKKELLNNIRECTAELLEWFDILHRLSEAGEMATLQKPFSLKQVIDSVVKIVRPSCKNQHIKLDVAYDSTIPEHLIGDPYRIQTILMNLVHNALKFNKKGGEIHLHITEHKKMEQDGSEWSVIKAVINDTGIGIPATYQDTIFELCSKVSSSWQGVYKGMGVGLKLVKQFLQDIQGEIHVTSEVGKGSTFTVLFPLKVSLLN